MQIFNSELNDFILHNPHLQQIHKRRPNTYNHSIRVASLVYDICSFDPLINGSQANEITKGALLHDYGKLNIPKNILVKPQKLTSEEYLQIQTHPVRGYLELKKYYSETILNCIRFHHERGDGKGYPDKLLLDEIPTEAKIVALCDSFDAMTDFERVKYGQHPYPLEKAYQLLDEDTDKGIYDRYYMDIFTWILHDREVANEAPLLYIY